MHLDFELVLKFVTLHGEHQYQFSFVETLREFIIAKLWIRKLGSSSVLTMHFRVRTPPSLEILENPGFLFWS